MAFHQDLFLPTVEWTVTLYRYPYLTTPIETRIHLARAPDVVGLAEHSQDGNDLHDTEPKAKTAVQCSCYAYCLGLGSALVSWINTQTNPTTSVSPCKLVVPSPGLATNQKKFKWEELTDLRGSSQRSLNAQLLPVTYPATEGSFPALPCLHVCTNMRSFNKLCLSPTDLTRDSHPGSRRYRGL